MLNDGLVLIFIGIQFSSEMSRSLVVSILIFYPFTNHKIKGEKKGEVGHVGEKLIHTVFLARGTSLKFITINL